MKKSNIIIFFLIIIAIAAIFGFAIWDANQSLNNVDGANSEQAQNVEDNAGNTLEQNIISNEVQVNETNTVGETNTIDTNVNTTVNSTNYLGEWYISQEAYNNAQEIDDILDRKEDNLITDEEFERRMSSEINTNIVELDVESYSRNTIRFDFKLISPAPTQREGKLDNIVVNLTDNVGTFTYTDNWGTSGNGTITLGDNKITLKLETTSAAQGAQWGVEGIYTFSYKRVD